MRVKNKGFFILAVLLITVTASSSGCISNSNDILGDIMQTVTKEVSDSYEVYSIDQSQLTVPVIPAQEPFEYEGIPEDNSRASPGFKIASRYYYNQLYENSEGVLGIYVKNQGEKSIFIYEFGLLGTETDQWYGKMTGITLLPDEEKNIGLIAIDIPENNDEITLKLRMSVLVESSEERWYEYKDQYFDEFTIDVSKQPDQQDPEYSSNPEGTFKLINEKIDPYAIEVRQMAAVSAKRYPGTYNIYQLCSLFDDTKKNIQYISDPRGRDVWSPPSDTLKVGAGDCDDYAILLASLVESIGGTSRIYLTDTHAFAAVYIGNEGNAAEIVEAIGKYYGPVPVYYTTDEYGSWLMMDPTSSLYAGGLPGGTAPSENGWTFLNTTQVVIIDIAP